MGLLKEALLASETIELEGVEFVRRDVVDRMVSAASATTPQMADHVTVKEAARMAHCDVHAVYKAIGSGLLKARVRNGTTRPMFLDREAVQRWAVGA